MSEYRGRHRVAEAGRGAAEASEPPVSHRPRPHPADPTRDLPRLRLITEDDLADGPRAAAS